MHLYKLKGDRRPAPAEQHQQAANKQASSWKIAFFKTRNRELVDTSQGMCPSLHWADGALQAHPD